MSIVDGTKVSAALKPSYRPGRPADRDTIVEFQLAMAWETEKLKLDEETLRRGVQAVFDDPSKGRYRIVELGERVVGMLLLLDEWSDWRNGKVWWIHSVYVVPEARGLGVFTSLYECVKAEVTADPGARGLRLYVERENTRAQRTYARLGMRDDHYLLYEWLK